MFFISFYFIERLQWDMEIFCLKRKLKDFYAFLLCLLLVVFFLINIPIKLLITVFKGVFAYSVNFIGIIL